MGGPRRGAIGLADTKAPMVRGWGPSKSLSAEDGAGGLQMGPVGWGGEEVRSPPCPFYRPSSILHLGSGNWPPKTLLPSNLHRHTLLSLLVPSSSYLSRSDSGVTWD